jgi:hypothetical protein
MSRAADYVVALRTAATGSSTKAASNTYVKAILANTNAYIASMSTDVQLANTNAYIATKSSLAQLANTNTFTVRTTGAAQTMYPSLTVANTVVFQKGIPIRQAGGNNVALALIDNGKLIYCVNTASAMNIHIPNNSSVAFPVGAEMSFLQHLTHASANTLGFSNAAGVILHSKEAANTVADRFTTAVIKKIATNTWFLVGNLS